MPEHPLPNTSPGTYPLNTLPLLPPSQHPPLQVLCLLSLCPLLCPGHQSKQLLSFSWQLLAFSLQPCLLEPFHHMVHTQAEGQCFLLWPPAKGLQCKRSITRMRVCCPRPRLAVGHGSGHTSTLLCSPSPWSSLGPSSLTQSTSKHEGCFFYPHPHPIPTVLCNTDQQ